MPNMSTFLVRAPRAAFSRSVQTVVCFAPLFVVAGCAAFPTLTAEPNHPTPRIESSDENAPFPGAPSTSVNPRRDPRVLNIPALATTAPTRQPATDEQIAALLPDALVDASLAPQSVPQFVATVFGGLLGLPYTMTPEVATRGEMISGGTGGSIDKRTLFRLTQQALKQYGIDVYIENGFVTVGSAEASAIGAQVTRDRATPQAAGRIVQFFPVQTIEVNVLTGLLADLFPNLGGARISPDQLTNSLIISGPGREVAQVVRVLREIDQPRFAGADVLRVEPVFRSTEDLASALDQVLTTEGYVVGRQAAAARSVVILSFPAANQLLIFTRDAVLMSRVQYWLGQLDQPAALGDKASTFVYTVRNTDAQSLGQLAIGQAPTGAQAIPPVGVPGSVAANGSSQAQNSPQAQGASGQFMGGRILTDPIGNRIIFTGTATEFSQLRNLLTTLDTPAPQVVIEVMIAEVTLTDMTKLGINFLGSRDTNSGVTTIGTEGIGVGGGGLLATFVGPDFRARLNAEASNRRVNILQRPQLVARSGGTAHFQVGTDVPIITSQRATDSSQNGNGTDILQSVQYRQTGVILDIKPVVYGDRVDITISQENSTAGSSPEGISSPTILNRSLTTQIAISDGWTGVLGGLISNNYNKVNSGIPFLKDIPLVGSAFQNNSVEGDRTELLILITPHIVRGDQDMADFTDRYSSDMNAAFRTGRGWSYTLTPFSLGSRMRGIGIDLPRPGRASDHLSPSPASAGSAPQDTENGSPAAAAPTL